MYLRIFMLQSTRNEIFNDNFILNLHLSYTKLILILFVFERLFCLKFCETLINALRKFWKSVNVLLNRSFFKVLWWFFDISPVNPSSLLQLLLCNLKKTIRFLIYSQRTPAFLLSRASLYGRWYWCHWRWTQTPSPRLLVWAQSQTWDRCVVYLIIWKDDWSVVEWRLPNLTEFSGALTSLFPGSSTVE